MDKRIAFLGMGVMGAPMTVNLLRRGFAVTVWNRTPDRPGVALARDAGATIAPSLADAVREAEIIFTCLGDVPDVEAVILGAGGIVDHAPAGALVVDTSTIGSRAATAIAAGLREGGRGFLDAPVSGGDIGARDGTLTIMVGGEERDFRECHPYFEAMGKTIRYCGPSGSGQAVKLCNQILGAVHMVALCEALEMAELQGIDPGLMIEVCETGAAGSWALSNLGRKITRDDLAPGFAIKHILKDLRLVGEILADADRELPGTDLAGRLFRVVAALEGGAEAGTQAMIRAYKG